MEGAIRTEIMYNLNRTIEILENREEKDIEELRELSDHGIEDVAIHKNLDLISITVLIYSLYKTARHLPEKDYQNLLQELKSAKQHLEEKDLGKYNYNIKIIFDTIKKSNIKIKIHLHDVLHAAKIKKGTILLHKGLSIGQAAGLMGLSNWDLQDYAGKTISLTQHHEATPAKTRTITACKIFGA